MIAIKQESPEVFYASEPLIAVGPDELSFLKERARENPRLRSRLCTHSSPSDSLHEMIIVHHRDCYVRPHRHRRNSEALHVVEGSAEVIVFDDNGGIDQHFAVGVTGNPGAFYYRMPPQRYHMLAITSEWLVFHETTTGPFIRDDTEFPNWAPDGSDPELANNYVRDIRVRMRRCEG